MTNYLDTRGVVAEYDGNRYTLTLGSQGSHIIRDIIAGEVMKLPPEKMRVITPDVGGGFGTKLFPYREYALAAVAAERLRKPVKWVGERIRAFPRRQPRPRQYLDRAACASTTRAVFSRSRSTSSPTWAPICRATRPIFPGSASAWRPALRHPGRACAAARGLHQHRAGRCLSRRGAAGSVLSDRARGRCRRARARHRAGCAPPAESHQAEGDALQDADRQGLRLRRFRRHAGARAGACRLGRLQQARGAVEARRAPARHRHCDLCRGLRQ